MASDESKKNRIMEYSFQRFTTSGILHVTMDEISRGVGIGKGTLYKFFPSKEALLDQTIDYIAGGIEKKINVIMSDDKKNPVEKLNEVLKAVGERLSKINPSVLLHMERSVPVAFEKIQEVRQKIIMTNLIGLFEAGKKTGHFEMDMDACLVAHILIGAANHVSEAQVLSSFNYSLDSLFAKMTATILKGCLTQEGRKIAFENKDLLS